MADIQAQKQTLIDFMFKDLLQKMFLRTSRLETHALSSHPGSSSLGGPGGNAKIVDYIVTGCTLSVSDEIRYSNSS